MPHPNDQPKKSVLPQVGCGLMLLLLAAGPVFTLGMSLPKGPVAALLLIGSDLLKLCFFVGFACLIIGLLRNRKTSTSNVVIIGQQTQSQENQSPAGETATKPNTNANANANKIIVLSVLGCGLVLFLMVCGFLILVI